MLQAAAKLHPCSCIASLFKKYITHYYKGVTYYTVTGCQLPVAGYELYQLQVSKLIKSCELCTMSLKQKVSIATKPEMV